MRLHIALPSECAGGTVKALFALAVPPGDLKCNRTSEHDR